MRLKIFVLLLCCPYIAWAAAQPRQVDVAVESVQPFFSILMYEGSLKSNVERMVRKSHWGELVWKAPVDYRWMGTIRMSGPDVMAVMEQILKDYPLQAVFYKGNRIVVIQPRLSRG